MECLSNSILFYSWLVWIVVFREEAAAGVVIMPASGNSLANVKQLIREQYSFVEGNWEGEGVSGSLRGFRACWQENVVNPAGGEIRAEYVFSVEGEDLR